MTDRIRRIKAIVPIPMDEAGLANRASQLPPSQVTPGFRTDFVAVTSGAALGDSHYDAALMDMSVLRAGLTAEAEGYDAVLIDTISDSALYALRSRLRIPVIGPGQSALHLACMLGHKFSIVTMWTKWFHFYRKLLTEYSLWPRCASLRSIDTRPDVTELLAGKEEIIFPALEAESRRAIEEDGADVIILGSTTMHQSHQHLATALSVPVINPGLVAYKLCEVVLELGLAHSKHAFPDPEILRDEALRGP